MGLPWGTSRTWWCGMRQRLPTLSPPVRCRWRGLSAAGGSLCGHCPRSNGRTNLSGRPSRSRSGCTPLSPRGPTRTCCKVARVDASTAWCVWIASGNPVYVGRCLPDEGAEAVFGRDPQGATAGVVAPYGRAVVQDGGYLVSGRWPYASGCQHSTWLFCCCTVCDRGQLRRTAGGDPEVRVL